MAIELKSTPLTLKPPVAEVLRRACEYYGVSEREVRGKRRFQHLALVRWSVAKYLRDTFKFSYPHIGRILNRDHTSIISGLKKLPTTTYLSMVDFIENYESKVRK